MSNICSSGCCAGLPGQFRLPTKLIPAEVSVEMYCSLCILGSEKKVLYVVYKGHLMIIIPKSGYSTLCKLLATNAIEAVGFHIYKFLVKRMELRIRQLERGHGPTSLTIDGKHLLSSFGIISLVPDGSSVMSAICLDLPECEECGTSECHYRLQCGTCEQFSCGEWTRLKGSCAYCRSKLDC
jgi:hypothetical protein